MSFPFVGLRPGALGATTGLFAAAPPAPVANLNTADAARTAAFVHSSEAQVEALLAQVRSRSSGELFYPDGKVPCPCGPEADNSDTAKAWAGDPNWCVRKDGPATAPVIRKTVSCGELPTLFWPDIFEAAKALLLGYLSNPPAQTADPVVQANWTQRVFELCTVMATATNVSPEVFCAFQRNPVGPNFVPRVKLALVDEFISPLDKDGHPHGRARVWVTYAQPESQGVGQDAINQATRPQAPWMTTEKLPGLPSAVAAMWSDPSGAPPGSDPNTWFGGMQRQTDRVSFSPPFSGYVEQQPGFGMPGSYSVPRQMNAWFDDALTPAFFKGQPLSRWGVNPQTESQFGGTLPEWVCANNRTAQWMQGDMQPFRPGWFIRDGVLAWPSDALTGDARQAIAALRGNGHGTRDQLTSLFVAMRGAWWKPGWIFYKTWGIDSSGFAYGATQKEEFGPGFVPGAWFYMSAAYRWGAWFAGLDYATIVNSALYFYASNYLPWLVSSYSTLGVSIATPDAVRAVQQQVSSMFAAASREQSSSRNLVSTTAASVAAVLAGTGAGAIAGLVLAVLSQLYNVFQQLADDNRAALAIEAAPIYSPLLRVPVDTNCHLDASYGASALAAAVPAVAAPAANAMIAAFVQSMQEHPELQDLRAPVPTPGWVYGVGGATIVAVAVGVVLALRGKR